MIKVTINDMNDIAILKNGKCLSTEYVNSRTKLKWKCHKDHIWRSSPSSIQQGHWCPYCAKIYPLTINEMCKLAESKNGECLSNKYINAHTKLKWKCKEGHKWYAQPYNIKLGYWCPYCYGCMRKTTTDMLELAKQKEGYFLSNNYFGSRQKYKWRCKEGHEWEASANNIKQGNWCPICSEGKSERTCRKFFEEVFKGKFPKKRYDWLRSPLGVKLELDGYNEKLKIAFEYQGKQHYEFISFWFQDIDNLKYLQKCDQIKRDRCKEKGITLIEVPYTVKFKNMKNYIINMTQGPQLII